jgi:hypothetical protein
MGAHWNLSGSSLGALWELFGSSSQLRVCMYCNFILNDCKLDFSQSNITNNNWRDKMILSILPVKPKNDKENNNNDKVTLSAIKMRWNNKQKNIARTST